MGSRIALRFGDAKVQSVKSELESSDSSFTNELHAQALHRERPWSRHLLPISCVSVAIILYESEQSARSNEWKMEDGNCQDQKIIIFNFLLMLQKQRNVKVNQYDVFVT